MVFMKDAAFISATGGTVTTSGDYKIHTFTGDGCFVVSQGPINTPGVDYLVVAGGGGGWKVLGGGGGGAGGYRVSNSLGLPAPTSPLANPTGITVTATTYPITVGGGGGLEMVEMVEMVQILVFSTITSTGGGGGDHGTLVEKMVVQVAEQVTLVAVAVQVIHLQQVLLKETRWK
jgi:hypothetical protein